MLLRTGTTCLRRLDGCAARTLTSKASPFAAASSAGVQAPKDGKLTREQEHQERVEAMAEMMREKTLREVEEASRVKHLVDLGKADGAVDEAVAAALGPQYASNYSKARGELGGPKGAEPTRFGDWEHKGRASDF